MCLLFEVIKVQNRKLHNLEEHNRRVAESRRVLFKSDDVISLSDFIQLPADLDDGLYKCRVVYARKVQEVEFLRYVPKQVKTLQIVNADALQYDHKYLDRSGIDELLQMKHADDILITQKGRVTDASFANVVFFDGKRWVTPAKPLLHGTKRGLLLEKGVIEEEEISLSDLHRFRHVAFINAMLDIGDVPFIPIEQILLPL